MAADLASPGCINWEAMETYYEKNGKDKTLAVINEQKEGANNIFLAHLSLAESTILTH
jgi:hypothetical protein